MEIPDLERTVCGASHYAKDFLFGHRCFDYLLQRRNGLQGEMSCRGYRMDRSEPCVFGHWADRSD
jgi:hypothetical protein